MSYYDEVELLASTYYLLSGMDSFYSISLRHANDELQLGSDILLKKKNKLRGDSIQAIFRIPKNLVREFAPLQKNKTYRKYRSTGKTSEKTIQLGSIGQQLHHNLRQTIVNQTKSILSPPKTSKSIRMTNNYLGIGGSSRDQAILNMQYESNMKTLCLLQKTIMKEDDLFYLQQDILQLNTTRLPILRKYDQNAKKFSRSYRKGQCFSPAPSAKYLQQNIQKNGKSRKPMASKEQKPYIRGWDIVQAHQV